jgi:hypothetical protein
MLGNCLVAVQLVASHEGLSSMELVSYIQNRNYRAIINYLSNHPKERTRKKKGKKNKKSHTEKFDPYIKETLHNVNKKRTK